MSDMKDEDGDESSNDSNGAVYPSYDVVSSSDSDTTDDDSVHEVRIRMVS